MRVRAQLRLQVPAVNMGADRGSNADPHIPSLPQRFTPAGVRVHTELGDAGGKWCLRARRRQDSIDEEHAATRATGAHCHQSLSTDA
ncbi:hypothetical protein [Leucobacter sp. 1207-22]|uniref:hypothetical protein n=1 Tax=Leucobacter sp. 1207-22 TaxID=2604456 RepID=UPI004063424F